MKPCHQSRYMRLCEREQFLFNKIGDCMPGGCLEDVSVESVFNILRSIRPHLKEDDDG